MQDRPSAAELVEALREYLESEVLPVMADPRARFRALVAANALGILGREIALGEPLVREQLTSLLRLLGRTDPIPEDSQGLRKLAQECDRDLARRIRSGHVPEGTLEHLKATTRDKLRIASPKYLERYR